MKRVSEQKGFGVGVSNQIKLEKPSVYAKARNPKLLTQINTDDENQLCSSP